MTTISMLSTIIPYGNKGDEAIYETSIELIRKYCPDSKISLISFPTPGFEPDHQLIRDLYNLDNMISYRLAHNILEIDTSKDARARYFSKFASSINRFWYWDLSPLLSPLTLSRRARSVSKLGDSDVFVIVGHPLVKGLIPICLRAYSIKMIARKPALVFPFSVSLHPFSRPKILDSIIRHYVATFLRKMDVILLREKYSMQYLQKTMRISGNLILSADTSFLLPPADERSTSQKLQKLGICLAGAPAIAVCPRGDYFSERVLLQIKYEEFIHKMAILIERLIDVLDTNIYFVPMTPNEDSRVINDIYKLINHTESVFIVDTQCMNAKEVKTFLSQMDLLITMRLHAAILAASSYVPSVVVMTAQDLKSVGVVKDLGLTEYFVHLEDPELTAKELVDNVLNLYNNLEDRKRVLRERVPEIQKRSEQAGKELKNFV